MSNLCICVCASPSRASSEGTARTRFPCRPGSAWQHPCTKKCNDGIELRVSSFQKTPSNYYSQTLTNRLFQKISLNHYSHRLTDDMSPSLFASVCDFCSNGTHDSPIRSPGTANPPKSTNEGNMSTSSTNCSMMLPRAPRD